MDDRLTLLASPIVSDASGDAGEMLVARTACNIVCGGYILLALGNGVFNGVRLFMCTASVAFLDWGHSTVRGTGGSKRRGGVLILLQLLRLCCLCLSMQSSLLARRLRSLACL